MCVNSCPPTALLPRMKWRFRNVAVLLAVNREEVFPPICVRCPPLAALSSRIASNLIDLAVSALGLGRVKTTGDGAVAIANVCWWRLCPHCRQEWPDAHDAHHPRHVVGQNVYGH